MTESQIILPAIVGMELTLLWVVLVSAVIAMVYGLYLARAVLSESPGTPKMVEVAAAIEEGAMAYLRQQIRTMSWFVVVAFIVLFLMYRGEYGTELALGVAVSFLAGVAASYGAGYVGMWMAVKGNVRAANGALRSFKEALRIAFQAGTVSGMFTVGFGLLGATLIFIVFKENAMKVLIGFGFGGTLAALFMRVGGGIFTKAADVGADLVGKVEAGIPEDDPRNAATIADNVGDNVGDCAGMAADMFESYEVTLVAGIILAVGTLHDQTFKDMFGADASMVTLKLIIFALLIRAVGVFASILGTWMVRIKDDELKDPMKPIIRGYWVSSLSALIGIFAVSYWYLGAVIPMGGAMNGFWFRCFLATASGIGLSVATLFLTNYFTHPDKRAVTETAQQTKTGPATMLLSGMAEGMESTVWSIVIIGLTIVSSYLIFGGEPKYAALASFGVALSGLGLLSTTGFILAMDTYGPITDNAHGIFEMSEIHDEKASHALTWMDAIGNTTKALTKGLAIATAVIAAVALFRSFTEATGLHTIGINAPMVLVGMLFGGAVPFLFSSFAIKAVGRAAFLVVEEVRRQFREHPGIMKGTEKPEYGACVAIVTRAAQHELVGPGILAVAAPVLVGFGLGPEALGGFLGGAILTGQLMAVFMSNTGGIWDNAKKKIEDGYMGGKGTEQHKAAVIGDTVGDPFKDTAGPGLNPLIKAMNLVAILIAPLIAINKFEDINGVVRFMISLVATLALGYAVMLSRQGSVVEAK